MTPEKLMRRIRIDPITGCWIWRGSFTEDGMPTRDGHSARREVYETFKGPIPRSKYASYRCDDSRCVRPDCTIICTKSGYMNRAKSRGVSFSDAAKSAKVALTRQAMSHLDMNKVREMRRSELSLRALAREYDVSYSNAWLIVNNRTWREGSPLATLARQAGWL